MIIRGLDNIAEGSKEGKACHPAAIYVHTVCRRTFFNIRTRYKDAEVASVEEASVGKQEREDVARSRFWSVGRRAPRDIAVSGALTLSTWGRDWDSARTVMKGSERAPFARRF